MIEMFKNQRFQLLVFINLVFAISFFTFWRAFGFDFWGEDWQQLWYAVFEPSMINNPLELREHPIVIYEEVFLAKFFGFETFYWQITGFLLKVLGSFAVSLMMFGVTNSKKAAFFTGLIYASSVGGIASFTWVAAHASSLVIPLLCIGVYFWVTQKFVLALVFLMISFWADPSRGIFGSIIVVLWDVLSFMQYLQRRKEYKIRIFILLVTLLFNILLFQYFLNFSGKVSIGYNFGIVLNNPIRSLNNFLTNIGNLLIGWIIPIEQNIFSVSGNNLYGKLAGYLFFIKLFLILQDFIKKRSVSSKIVLIFLIWIPIFFFPNWLLPNQEMIQNGQVIGVTHRYFTLSAIGIVCLLGYLLLKIKKPLVQFSVLLLIIFSNIFISNQLLAKESEYRSLEVTKPIWDKIEKEVPVGEENSLLFIKGEDKQRVNIIAQAKIPFAIRRGISIEEQLWPYSTSDPGVVRSYLCGTTGEGEKIPLSNLHAWDIRGNTLDNISEEVRKEFAETDCNFH